MFEALIQELSSLPQIEAIALGGSRAGTVYDDHSDYDIYLYCTETIPEAKRREIIGKYASYCEYGNQFWELEDNGTFINGIDFDILYRNLNSFAAEVASVVEGCEAHNAYTTCMWHNLLTCRVLYDRDGRLSAAKQRFSVAYPEELRKNILSRGWKLLHSHMPAYDGQVLKAAKRGDWVSVNHRTAAFLETYFDILFALNKMTHPGEKRMVQYCKALPVLPEAFEENLDALFSDMFTNPEKLEADLRRIVTELQKII